MSYEQPVEPSAESTPRQQQDLPRVIKLAQLMQSGEQRGQPLVLTPEQQEAERKLYSEFVGRVLARRLSR